MAEQMRYLVISDTHGSYDKFKKLLNNEGEFDFIIHAGDYLYHGPRNRIPDGYYPEKLADFFKDNKNRLIGVRGNCDADVDLMIMNINNLFTVKEIKINGLSVIIFHGHHEVNKDADIFIRGHTHIAELEKENDRILLNPGSPSLPKDDTGGSYAVIRTFEDKTELVLYSLEGINIKKIELKHK
ncbi:MAG: phosphodiesterase [Kosmotoga sp.]|nr:MAG: phosphodiesterase [Kosmotoga sp.]